jgi:hypothetical protein
MPNDPEVGVGLSREWDPEKAGREVVKTALKNLNHDPKFFLLFCTIHFDKGENGIDRFVKAAYESLPEDTPLVGGTVAGFMNNYGCYTRGATGKDS